MEAEGEGAMEGEGDNQSIGKERGRMTRTTTKDEASTRPNMNEGGPHHHQARPDRSGREQDKGDVMLFTSKYFAIQNVM